MSANTSRSPRPYCFARKTLSRERGAPGTGHRRAQYGGSYERNHERGGDRRGYLRWEGNVPEHPANPAGSYERTRERDATRTDCGSKARSAEGIASQHRSSLPRSSQHRPFQHESSQYGSFPSGSSPPGSFQLESFQPESSWHGGSPHGTSQAPASICMSMRSLASSFSTLNPFDSITRHDDWVDDFYHGDDDPGPRALVPSADDDGDFIDHREANRRRVNDWDAGSGSIYSDIGSTLSCGTEHTSGTGSMFSNQGSMQPPSSGRNLGAGSIYSAADPKYFHQDRLNDSPGSIYSGQDSMQSLPDGRSASPGSICSGTFPIHSHQRGLNNAAGAGSVYDDLNPIHPCANNSTTGAGSMYSEIRSVLSDATPRASEGGPAVDSQSGRAGGGDDIMSRTDRGSETGNRPLHGLGLGTTSGDGPSFSGRLGEGPSMNEKFGRGRLSNNPGYGPRGRKRYGYRYGVGDSASGRGRAMAIRPWRSTGRGRGSGYSNGYDQGFDESCRLAEEFQARASHLSPEAARHLRQQYEACVARISGEHTRTHAQRLKGQFRDGRPGDCGNHCHSPTWIKSSSAYQDKQTARW